MISLRSDQSDFVELEQVPSTDAHLQLSVRVSRSTFTASIETWIERESWFQFAQELTILETTRRGEARVESTSPGELRLVVRALDRAGHLGVEGSVGIRTFDSTVQLEFSVFAFDPSQIVSAAREAREISEALG